ncbi:MAG: protein kinase, partial [Myxococcota bacterium]
MSRLEDTSPVAGQRIGGRYDTLYLLDAGATGLVYAARDIVDDEVIALKVLPADGPGSEAYDLQRLRFEAEVGLAAQIRHPHVVAIRDHGVDDARFYIAMELLKGTSLAGVVLQGPQSPAFVIHVGKQVCAALGEAHRRGVVHRDVKPGNVMVVPTAEDASFVKVIDFGLATPAVVLSPDEASAVVRGPVEGTPHFVAPEQIRRLPLDGRADIYGLGAMLYTMLAGEPPFGRAHSEAEVLRKQLAFDAPRLVSVDMGPASAIPEGLASLVARCTRRDRTARPPSTQAVMEALLECEAELLGHPTLGTDAAAVVASVSTPPAPEPEASPRAVRLTLAIALFSLFTVVTGYGMLGWGPTRPAAPPTGAALVAPRPATSVVPRPVKSGQAPRPVTPTLAPPLVLDAAEPVRDAAAPPPRAGRRP